MNAVLAWHLPVLGFGDGVDFGLVVEVEVGFMVVVSSTDDVLVAGLFSSSSNDTVIFVQPNKITTNKKLRPYEVKGVVNNEAAMSEKIQQYNSPTQIVETYIQCIIELFR